MGSRIVCGCESVGATRGYYFRCKCDSKNLYFIPPGIVYVPCRVAHSAGQLKQG